LYEQALGAHYAQLPAAVQRFHRLRGQHVLHGQVQTQAVASLLARALAIGLGTPRAASSGPLRLELTAGPNAERWARHFPRQTMTSQLRLVNGHLEERIGVLRLLMRLTALNNKLVHVLVGLRCLGLPCPQWLLPQLVAEESGNADQLHFEVAVTLPLVGLIARYNGHLIVAPEAPT
jgi:hypothetical protein